MKTTAAYTGWPLLPELFPTSFPGVQTKQDQLVVDIDRPKLVARMQDFFSATVSDAEMARRHPGSMDGHSGCDIVKVRKRLQERGIKTEYFVPFLYKAFDRRWIYWEPETALLGRKSPELFPNVFPGNLFIEARQKEALAKWTRGTLTTILPDNFGNGFSNFFPFLLRDQSDPSLPLVDATASRRIGDRLANLTDEALAYLNTFAGVTDAPHLFHHAIAVLHAPQYAEQNADALRQDWPRIPLPATREALLASADLGRKVTAILDPETAVESVTAGMVSTAMKLIGSPQKVGGGQLADADLAVTAQWGITGKGGVTMPSKGKVVERPFTDEEKVALGEDGARLLGPDTCDVYLNDAAFWRNIPRRVWDYTLGGYQVLKKWLSYREKSILGRALRHEEVGYVRDIARRIAALLLLGPTLDAGYTAVSGNPFPWPPAVAPATT